MAIVAFDIPAFREQYPRFEKFSDIQLQFFFKQACQYCNNGDDSIVTDLEERELLLWLLVCHIATLEERGDVVGSTQSASEGSVSVSFNALNLPMSAQSFAQTQCGLRFWELYYPYRTFFYVP